MADPKGGEGASFSAVLGHENAKNHLQSVLASRQLSHAYLIEGPHGVGKKTLASAFIQALLCEKKGVEACGQCSTCRRFAHGNDPDVKWIRAQEGKNSISVKQIREDLVADISIRPYQGSYKIYLIDQAELLTVEAQNAMLKTLEEPPSYGLIILLAKSSDAFLPTIISRCVKISLQPLSDALVGEGLTRRGIAPERAALAAAFAQGCMGQALSLCENESFEAMREEIFTFLAQIPQLSAYEVMAGARLLERYKGETDMVFTLLLIWYRDVLMDQITGGEESLICLDRAAAIRGCAAYYTQAKVMDIIDTVLDIQDKLRANANRDLAIDCLLMSLK